MRPRHPVKLNVGLLNEKYTTRISPPASKLSVRRRYDRSKLSRFTYEYAVKILPVIVPCPWSNPE